MLNLNIIIIFNQLDIGRAIEVFLSFSELNSFSYQNNFKIAFKFKKLGFFDLKLFEEYGTNDLIYLSKDTICKSVYLFIERIRDVAKIKISIIV
jgi:hypothetical protein